MKILQQCLGPLHVQFTEPFHFSLSFCLLLFLALFLIFLPAQLQPQSPPLRSPLCINPQHHCLSFVSYALEKPHLDLHGWTQLEEKHPTIEMVSSNLLAQISSRSLMLSSHSDAFLWPIHSSTLLEILSPQTFNTTLSSSLIADMTLLLISLSIQKQ